MTTPLFDSSVLLSLCEGNLQVASVFSRRPWFWSVYSIYHIPTIYYSVTLNKISYFKRHTYVKLVWPLWCVGWYDTFILCILVSNVHHNCIIQDSLYHAMDIYTMWHCSLVRCTPSQSIWLVLGCALLWCWVSLCAPFTISLIEFYFIMIFTMIVVTIIWILMAILFILNYTIRLSVTT